MSGLATQQQGGALSRPTLQTIQALAAGAGLFPTQGNIFVVNPRTGDDSNPGTYQDPLKNLLTAYNLAQANQNDTIYLCGSSNTASLTTAYQLATLNWAKDLVHLIGINDGPLVSQRSRIAFDSAYAVASNLFTLSGNGCLIQNIALFAGVASALPTGAVKVTGSRNVFANCHLAGIGNDANDIAGAYSLNLSGGSENSFLGGAIGLDTVARGTNANSEILIDTGAARNLFSDVLIYALLEHATNHPLVKLAAATSIDRYLRFKNCMFLNESVNYAIAQAGNFKLVQALTQGFITLENCITNSSDNATAVKWDVDDRNQIALFNAPTPAADTAGCTRQV